MLQKTIQLQMLFKSNLTIRGVSGNMGQSDILEVFSIYAQASSSAGLSSELARVLIQFDTDAINTDRSAGNIPASGSVNFFLKMYDAEHTQTTPKNYTLVVSAISQSWDEGLGLDMEEYSDEDASNWISASSGQKWVNTYGTTLFRREVTKLALPLTRWSIISLNPSPQDLKI